MGIAAGHAFLPFTIVIKVEIPISHESLPLHQRRSPILGAARIGENFGEHVRNFREGRCMPFRAKVTAIITMWVFVSISLFVGIPDSMILAKIITFLGAATGTVYVIRLRTI